MSENPDMWLSTCPDIRTLSLIRPSSRPRSHSEADRRDSGGEAGRVRERRLVLDRSSQKNKHPTSSCATGSETKTLSRPAAVASGR